MRILFTVIPEKGHLNPYIPVAQALQARGHVVAFHAGADIRGQLSAAGLDLFLGQPDKPEPPAISRGRHFAEQIRDAAWLRGWIKSLLVDAVPAAVEPLRALVRQFSPDVIVTDPMLYQSVIVAEQEGIKWAAVSNSLNPVIHDDIRSELLATVEWLSPARRDLFSAHGVDRIDFRGCDSLSPYLTTCFSTREMIGRDVDGVHLTGPSLLRGTRGDEVDFQWEKLDPAKKKIFMSFGSQIYYQPERFRKVMGAVDGCSDLQLILSVSELMDAGDLGRIPDNVIVARYVPQVKLLDRVDLFITHGGANSVMEAYAAGVPILIAPLCNDQFHQAWFIRQSGAGGEIALDDMEPAQIRDALYRALDDRAMHENVSRVHRSYRVDGAARTAELVEEMCKC